jgi:hypothetical protein
MTGIPVYEVSLCSDYGYNPKEAVPIGYTEHHQVVAKPPDKPD